MDFAFVKSRYDDEHGRAEKLTGAVGLPVSVLTALGGSLIFMGQGFSYALADLTWPFAVLVAVATVLFGTSCWYLWQTYKGYDVLYLPTLAEMEHARMELLGFYESTDSPRNPDQDITETLRVRMIEATDFNTRINDKRETYLNRAKVAVIFTLLATVLAGVFYGLDQRFAPPTIPVMRLIN